MAHACLVAGVLSGGTSIHAAWRRKRLYQLVISLLGWWQRCAAWCSSRALKEAARAGEGDGLVHDPFADAEVLVDPLVGLLVVAGELFRLEAVDAASLVGWTGIYIYRLEVCCMRIRSLTSGRWSASCRRERQTLETKS